MSRRVVVSSLVSMCRVSSPRPAHTGGARRGLHRATLVTQVETRATIQSLAIQLDCPLRTSLLGRVLIFREFGAIGPVAVRGPRAVFLICVFFG